VSRNLKLTLMYEGSSYHGWQIQPGRPTIQSELSAAIERLTGEKILPQGSGRTDAGVHALRQVATWTTESNIPCENLLKALNSNLPPTIRVTAVEEVPSDFHPRRSAKAKTYRYRIYRGSVCPPFVHQRVWHYPYPLDEAAIVAAAGTVEGTHDFTSFAAVDPERDRDGDRDNVRTILSSAWQKEEDELIYQVRGSGFLHHMVRNLVGLFILIGKGMVRAEQVADIISARSRSANPAATAPPDGLYLVNVEY